ncbi:hypothetical protein [Nocardioides houyundeii]|uniref:hypothetical protein n=1 Tax=Nocardioides houyundeii TaxID=2045452 RepID=UPI000DF2A006|nr:hypothetical protein [Nocardioides houyundeii]
MSELHELLARATDRIESPRLEHAALQTARRRRTRRRGAAAAVVTSALVATVVVGIQVADRGDRVAPAPPTAQNPTSTPSAKASGSQEKVWPQWDPRDVDQLPAAPDRIAPALPEVIDPPASSPPLSDDPVGSAVLVIEQGGRAQVLGTGGDWRTVPIDGRFPVVSLSPGGARLAVYYGYDNRVGVYDYRVTVHDLATGGSRTLEAPAGFEPWDDAGWMFLNEETLLFSSGPQTYAVAIDSGEAEEMSLPTGMSTTLDPAGDWLSSADFAEPNVLTDYAGGTPREVSMDRTGPLLRIEADEDTVVGTTYDDQAFSVVVADRQTLTPQFRLPVLDYDGNYSNWGLGPVALADDGTVLLRVAAIGRRVDGFRLVAWDPAGGDLSIVTSTALPVEASVVFAQGALRAVDPG